jgi:hypothetical protein
MKFGDIINEIELDEHDKRLIKMTKSILSTGVKPLNSKEATSLGNNAADDINNSGNRKGYTVYGSHYSGIIMKDNEPESVIFAGVGYGSGDNTMSRGIKVLRENGYKVKLVNDEDYKGIVVSK